LSSKPSTAERRRRRKRGKKGVQGAGEEGGLEEKRNTGTFPTGTLDNG
jgi:hypothetical protein